MFLLIAYQNLFLLGIKTMKSGTYYKKKKFHYLAQQSRRLF